MTERPTTERDLRDALRTLVPDGLDARSFRDRLDRQLEQRSQPSSPAEDDVVALQPAGPGQQPHRRRGSRTALAVTLAACAAAVVAVAVAVVPGAHTRHARPGVHPTLPAAIRAMANPGSVALGTYSGSGTRTIVIAPHVLPAYTGYSVYGSCRGGGTLVVNSQTLFGACASGAGLFGTGGAVENGRLAVRAGAHTSWRLTLVIEPDSRTNASVQSPVDADLSGPDTDARQSGQGPATARFQQPRSTSVDTTYRVRLVCHGSGVTLPDLATTGANGPAVRGLATKTCFAGREYVWTYVRLTTPTAVGVVASPGTTWTIAVDAM